MGILDFVTGLDLEKYLNLSVFKNEQMTQKILRISY